MRKINSTSSSQQGPTKRDYNYTTLISKIFHKPYSNMFIEDFCSHYSIALAKHISERNFFKVDDNQKIFKSIFGYDFLEYDLDKLLSNITTNLMIFGKAYVERIYSYDDQGNIVNIYYKSINCKNIKHRKNCITYKIKTENNQKIKGQISNKLIIAFNLKDLGFSKKFFIRKIKKLKYLELPKSDTSLSKYFDIHQFQKKSDYNLLKMMKSVHWDARNHSNTYVTEPYSLYRSMMFEKLQNLFLEYLISKINEDIDFIKSETKFSGKIIFDSIAQNYDNLITELESGKKNCEQIGNIIFKGL